MFLDRSVCRRGVREYGVAVLISASQPVLEPARGHVRERRINSLALFNEYVHNNRSTVTTLGVGTLTTPRSRAGRRPVAVSR